MWHMNEGIYKTTEEGNTNLKIIDGTKINFQITLKLILWNWKKYTNSFPRLKTTSPLAQTLDKHILVIEELIKLF